MRSSKRLIRFLFCAAIMLMVLFTYGERANALLIAYTNQSSFSAAISGYDAKTLDFESIPNGNTIASGDTVGGVTFSYDIFGESMLVVNTWSTTSGVNSLGLTGGNDSFWDGDSFAISFANPIHALGMYFITSDPAVEGEIRLVTPFGTASNSGTDYFSLPDGGLAYFIGLTSSDGFSGANIAFADQDYHFVYNIDDIVSANTTPEPATLLLLGIGLICVGLIKPRFEKQFDIFHTFGFDNGGNMGKQSSITIVAVLVIGFLAIMGSEIYAADPRPTLDGLQTQINTINQSINVIDQSIDGITDVNNDQYGKLADLQTQIDGIVLTPGPIGPVGPPGPVGPKGDKGDKGDKPSHLWSGTFLQFENPDGTFGMSVNLKGEQGIQGLTGATGATGQQGIQGEKGDPGPPGQQGTQGIQGPQGIQGDKGDKGDKGKDGLNSLVNVTPEPAGTNCATGGQKVESGLDTDNSGTLDGAEIIQTRYVCNGANGTNGYTVLSGLIPAAGGVDGDFYIDTTAKTISGPKAGGVWPTPVSLIGPAGQGIATGGTAGQVLSKIDGANYNTQWINVGDMSKSVYDTNNNGKIDADKIDSGISATLIGAGTVDNTEFGYLDGLTSPIQTQLNAKFGSVNAGTGLAVSSGSSSGPAVTLAVDTNVIQKRVSGTCAAGSIRTINADGTVTCQTETDPKVGSVTANKWCVGDGSQVQCNQSTPVMSETDPKVGNLSANVIPKWGSTSLANSLISDDGNRVFITSKTSGVNPLCFLNIKSNESPGNQIALQYKNSAYSVGLIYNEEPSPSLGFPAFTIQRRDQNGNWANNPANLMAINVSTGQMHVYGTVTAPSTLLTSDVRYKKNITPLENSLEKVTRIRGVSYEWKTDEYPDKGFTEGTQLGLIAQEVEAVIPELVSTDNEGYKAISYEKLTPVLVEAVKEQQAQIKLLKEQLEALQKELQALKNQ